MIEIDAVIMLDREICHMKQKADAMRACLYPSGIRYDGVKVQTSPSGDALTSIMDEIVDIEAKIEEMKTKVRPTLVHQLEEIFDTLEDVDQRTALTGYYCSNKRVYEIAQDMNRSRSGVYERIKTGRETLVKSGHIGQTDEI